MGAIGGWNEGLWAIVPTICVCLIFWFAMRAILRSDRTEREAQARIEAQEDELLLARTRLAQSQGERTPGEQTRDTQGD